ncbi:MAG: hypothetical protein HUK23_07215 [Sphaerochaetaceae bacterium]|nr:hypothetical protein [Sphaerochaetaceae bacterium]
MFWVIICMMTSIKKAFCILLISVLCVSVSFCQSVKITLPLSGAGVAIYPYDNVIGQTCDKDSSPSHMLISQALSQSYSFEWTEKFLGEQNRKNLVDLFGQWLSENLPCNDYLISVSHENADGSVGLNIRVGQDCFALIVDNSFIIAMKSIKN